MQYQAFFSYSHAGDSRLAEALQSSLQRFAKPWYRLRSLRVFRDKTALAVNPGLWPAIETALGASDFFILIAAPEAAASPWVGREVQWWCANRPVEKLLIVLTGGELAWAGHDFDWARTTALPRVLMNVMRQEPLFLDPAGRDPPKISRFATPGFARRSPTGGADPRAEQGCVIGEDIRQHRRTLRLAWSARIGLSCSRWPPSSRAGWRCSNAIAPRTPDRKPND
jgi:hypothetical protein